MASDFLQMSLWVSQLPVKCGAICSWVRECMKWWGVRLHTLLWSELCEFKGPCNSIETANEATDSHPHLTACWFIHYPTPVEEVNLWLQGYCRLEPTEYELREMQTWNKSYGKFPFTTLHWMWQTAEGWSSRDAGVAVSVNSSEINLTAHGRYSR